MELHVDYLINVLPIVGTGMLGVFLVTGVIIAGVSLSSAERTAASWMSTSEQSCPSSTIRFTFSRWPMARDSRFSTAF